MSESDSNRVHNGRSSVRTDRRRGRYPMSRSQSPLALNGAIAVSDDDDDDAFSSSDDENGDDDDDGSKDDSASQYRFWATRPPHVSAPTSSTQSRQSGLRAGSLDDSNERKSQLVLRRRPGGGFEHQGPEGLENVMATYAALQLRTEVPGAMGRDHQSRILFVSLLEDYCRTYDDDPLRNRRLFFAICRTLYTMGIVGKEYVDEMSSIRATYSGAFRQLVVRAQESLGMYEQHDIETGIRSLMNSVAEGSDSLDRPGESSYTDEWSVSHGGFMPAEHPFPSTYGGGSSASSDSDSAFSGTDTTNSRSAYRAYSSNNHSEYRAHSNYKSTRSNATTAASDPHRLRRGSRSGSTANTFETMMMDVQRSRYHDDFIQLRCLGKGGFGKVYEVRNKLDGRPYAVKHIRIKGEITAEKTLREIKTLANLDHPNIVRYYSSWIEVTRLRKRAPNNRHEAHSTSPFMALYGKPLAARQPNHQQQQQQQQQGAMFDGFALDPLAAQFAADSPSSRTSLSELWQDESAGNPFDSATGISIVSASLGSSYDGDAFVFEDSMGNNNNSNNDDDDDGAGVVFEDSFGNGEAFVMAEVSIGHTNESYDQRRETENNVVFEQSGGDAGLGNAQSCPPAFARVESPEHSVYAGDMPSPALVESPEHSVYASNLPSPARINLPAPIPIRPGPRHRRQRSLHVANDGAGAANMNRRSLSVLDTISGQQAQSLPSQVLAGIDLAQPFAAETTLFVQMQLCQTTLQEFLLHRNQRIGSRQPQSSASASAQSECSGGGSDAEARWCGMTEQELLIDPVMNVRLFRAIVEGVKYFHTRGVIHRDLKGANVFLDIVYADSGGNPISRGGSGIGRPGPIALSRNHSHHHHGSVPSFGPFRAGNVHADAWDAVDGGNLKETPPVDDSLGAGKGAGMRSRNVDWDAVFDSVIANRSVNAGRPPNAAAPARMPVSKPTSASSRLSAEMDCDEVQPPMVTFIPRIGDFGLATKSTLGYRAPNDEYAFIGAGSSASDGLAHSASTATAVPSEAGCCSQSTFASASAASAAAKARRASVVCDERRTSNVGTITYAAPEQLRDQATEYNEKADIYSLGIIFFELYYPFATAMERVVVIKDLRRGVFPPQFLQMWPKEAAFILRLMDADPEKRPSAREILAFDLIDVPTLESAQLKREVNILKQQLRLANQRNEELGMRVQELERIVDMSI